MPRSLQKVPDVTPLLPPPGSQESSIYTANTRWYSLTALSRDKAATTTVSSSRKIHSTMNQKFESLIDGTSFGIIADYLRNPRTPEIQYVLHLKDREALAPVAEALDRALSSGALPQTEVNRVLNPLLSKGELKISAREADVPPDYRVDAKTVNRRADCYVIYQPPFYTTHTPGLFEGKVFTKSPARDSEKLEAAQEKKPMDLCRGR